MALTFLQPFERGPFSRHERNQLAQDFRETTP
jgi:hypothetical protein